MPTDESSEDAFGFSAVSASTKEKIKHIRPSLPVEGVTDIQKIDEIADNAGFVSREAPQSTDYVFRNTRAQRAEPRIPLNMRVPVSLGSAFQRFCEDNRYSYPEALAEVMRRAGLSIR